MPRGSLIMTIGVHTVAATCVHVANVTESMAIPLFIVFPGTMPICYAAKMDLN